MAKILNFFRRRRDRLEQDLDRELRYHLDRRVEELMQERRRAKREARRQANIEFGGVRPGAGRGARDLDLAMARCARARRPLRDAQPGQELGVRAGRRRRARARHRRQRSPFSRSSTRSCSGRSPTRTPSASSRSRRSGPTPDAPARTCQGPTFSTGRRRTTCSRRWPRSTAERTSRPSSATAPCLPTPVTSRRISSRSSARPRLRDAC